MSYFKQPEIATEFGALDDNAFQDGSPVSAHVLRELARNANRLKAKGGLMYRWVANNETYTEADPDGEARIFCPPTWVHMCPASPVPVPKKPGLRKMRVRFRLSIPENHIIQIFVGSAGQHDPQNAPDRADRILECTGAASAALTAYTISDVPITRDANTEAVSFMWRYLAGTGSPALLATGTYGGASSGTVTGVFTDSFSDHSLGASGWNRTGANQVHKGGHYVRFSRDGDGAQWFRIIWGAGGPDPASSSVTNSLVFAPYVDADTSYAFYGADYEIRKLPECRIASIAAYSQDESAPEF